MDQAEKLRNIFQDRTEESSVHDLSSRVITVTSGKGGVGKTNFAVNLAIYLSKQGKKVVIMDADFGLANIEILFGILPKYSLADVLRGYKGIDEVITNGPLDIKFISGGSGLKDLTDITERQMTYLINNFEYLDSISDIIIIDTGAGISKSVVNFIKASKESIIVTTPEPTSITDAYALIKTLKEGRATLPQFKIVINKVDDYEEGEEIFKKLHKVTERFLNVAIENLGSIPYDPNLVKAVKKQQPAALLYPNSHFSKSVESICNKLLFNITDDDKINSQQGILSFMKRLVNIFGN